ncbi:MAG: class I SAM-dependent methyltransferase [Longimicrobiales bacterium]
MSERKLTAYDVADHYDAAYFDDLAARYRERNRFARRRIENVFSLLPPVHGKSVIDLGCGMGTFTIECARRGAVAIGIDPAPAAVAAARRVADAEHARSAFFIQADAVRLPLGDESADVVLAADVTEHLDDETLGRVLREATRVLRPGGQLVLYTPEQRHLFERLRDHNVLLSPDPSHIAVRSADELAAAVAKAGLRVELVSYLPSHLPVWNLLERGFQRWVPLLRRRIGVRASRA